MFRVHWSILILVLAVVGPAWGQEDGSDDSGEGEGEGESETESESETETEGERSGDPAESERSGDPAETELEDDNPDILPATDDPDILPPDPDVDTPRPEKRPVVALAVDLHIGLSYPRQINLYIRDAADQVSIDGNQQLSASIGIGVSAGLITPKDWLIIRPNIEFYSAGKSYANALSRTGSSTMSLHSFTPGVAADFFLNPSYRARVFLTLGFSFYLGSFKGIDTDLFPGMGPALEAGAGVQVLFGRKRRIGVQMGLFGRAAWMLVTPERRLETGLPDIDWLDFSGAYLRLGPVFRI